MYDKLYYFLTLIVIILFIWIIICYLQSLYYSSKNKTKKLLKDVPKNIPILDNTKLKKFFYKILKDYKKCNLFSIAGTALGCIRYNDILPWDDDIDLGIDVSKVSLFLKISKEKGYNLESTFFGYKMHKDGYFIDIFIFKQFRDNYSYISGKARKKWPEEYFKSKGEVFPTVNKKFGNFYIPTPNKLQKYCNRAFNNWDRIVIYQPPHRLSELERDMIIFNPFIPKKWYINSR